MFAEITVTVAEPFSTSLEEQAREWFKPLNRPEAATALRLFRSRLELAESAILVKMTSTYAMLLFRDDMTTLKAHVEVRSEVRTLRHLKELAEERAGRLRAFVSAQGASAKAIHIRVVAEGELMETGRRQSWIQKLITAGRKEVAARLSVPVSTFLASLLLDFDVHRATFNALTAAGGMVIWLLLSATFDTAEYKYE